MMGSKNEPVLCVKRYGEIFEILVRHLDNRATGVAKEMLMQFLHQVVDGPTVSKVDVVDDASLFERLQGTVDRRQMDVRLRFLDRGSEITRAHVPARSDQSRQQGSSCRGDPQVFLPECSHDPVQGRGLAGPPWVASCSRLTSIGANGANGGAWVVGAGRAVGALVQDRWRVFVSKR